MKRRTALESSRQITGIPGIVVPVVSCQVLLVVWLTSSSVVRRKDREKRSARKSFRSTPACLGSSRHPWAASGTTYSPILALLTNSVCLPGKGLASAPHRSSRCHEYNANTEAKICAHMTSVVPLRCVLRRTTEALVPSAGVNNEKAKGFTKLLPSQHFPSRLRGIGSSPDFGFSFCRATPPVGFPQLYR